MIIVGEVAFVLISGLRFCGLPHEVFDRRHPGEAPRVRVLVHRGASILLAAVRETGGIPVGLFRLASFHRRQRQSELVEGCRKRYTVVAAGKETHIEGTGR